MWDTPSLYEAILALETEGECRRFFEDVLTRDERAMITKRWRTLCLMCVEAPTQREASARLGVSLDTVNTAKSVLENGTGEVGRIIWKIYRRQNILTGGSVDSADFF